MKRICAAVISMFFACACGVRAQDANPNSANLKASWGNIRDLLTRMADKMPDENYRFKPTPDVQDFGQRMAHIIGANMRTCAAMKGEQKSITFGAAPTKAEIATAMKQANDECDSVYNSLTDADLSKMMSSRGGQHPELSVAEGMLEHSQEVYGYMAVYLRLKGIVPPSSERNER